MPADEHYKGSVQSLETFPNDPPRLAPPCVRPGCSDRQPRASACTSSASSLQRYRRESDTAVMLTYVLIANVIGLAVLAWMAAT